MYSAANSLSPMMFRKDKQHKRDEGGTRNERFRSKSMEHIFDVTPGAAGKSSNGGKSKKKDKLRAGSMPVTVLRAQWREVSQVKTLSPVVTCILPHLSRDFVCSALLAMGATPLITEDWRDIEKDLTNSKVVVVDLSAPQAMVEAFMECYKPASDLPLVLVCSQAGSNDRIRLLGYRIIEKLGPTFINGRLGDIYAMAQIVLEKGAGTPLDMSPQDSEDGGGEEGVCMDKVAQSLQSSSKNPKVVVDNGGVDSTASLPPVLRRAKLRSKSPISPTESPSPSPPRCASPRESPVNSPRGVRRFMKKRNTGVCGVIGRVPTVLPRVMIKGQFRDGTMQEVPITDALEQGQKLAAHTNAFIHLYETNLLTSGEVVVQINNSQLGMEKLHSTLACSGAVVAAVLGCVKMLPADDEEDDDIQLKHCSHALGLYYVAAEEAGAEATSISRGMVSPGALREKFIDALHYLDEPCVYQKALLNAHSEGVEHAGF